jgi:hypothetical protein
MTRLSVLYYVNLILLSLGSLLGVVGIELISHKWLYVVFMLTTLFNLWWGLNRYINEE